VKRAELRAWAARASLIGGTLACLLLLRPRVPREQELAFKLTNGSAQQLEVSWTPDSESEPQGGFSMNLGPKASRTVRHTADLANGPYRFDIVVTRVQVSGAPAAAQADPPTTSYVRRVTLEGLPTTIHLP